MLLLKLGFSKLRYATAAMIAFRRGPTRNFQDRLKYVDVTQQAKFGASFESQCIRLLFATCRLGLSAVKFFYTPLKFAPYHNLIYALWTLPCSVFS